jgi:hypothetical protein
LFAGHPFQDRVHIGGEVFFRRNDRCCPSGADCDLVNEEPVFRIDRLITFIEIGVGEHAQDFIRSCAANDAIRIEAVNIPDRGPQFGRPAVRIKLQGLCNAFDCCGHRVAETKRCFI